jgi:hypothetical protein
MSDEDAMDTLLRGAFEKTAVPTLSSSFERRIARHVSRRELTSSGRRVLVGYAAMALAVSIWTMRTVSLDWSLIAAAILTPAAVTFATLRRRITN